MRARSISAPWLVRLTWEELGTLMACLFLDFVEIIFPALQTPVIGDVFDLAGVAFSLLFFRWVGLISLLEIVPGIDVLPIFTLTWLVWYVTKRRMAKTYMESLLERWR